jgi:hypothetical protein
MSRNAKVTAIWGDDEHTFRLGIAEFDELQEKTDCGPFELFRRLAAGTWRVGEIRQTLRLGLIGGGMKDIPAVSLVARYFDRSEAPAEHAHLAMRILHAGLFGPAEDNVGKKAEAEEGLSESSPTVELPSPPSTETAPPSASRRRKSAA